jgi:hypothetical protein
VRDISFGDLARDIAPLIRQEANSLTAAEIMAARNDDPDCDRLFCGLVGRLRNELETIVLIRSLLLSLVPFEDKIRSLLEGRCHDTAVCVDVVPVDSQFLAETLPGGQRAA